MKSHFKKLSYESKFSRRFASWCSNHSGASKMKKTNRQEARSKLKEQLKKDISSEQDICFAQLKKEGLYMLWFFNERYTQDNGNGYDLYTRDAVCSKCAKVIAKQEKYCDIYKDFKFTNGEGAWEFCPFCGERLR